MRGWLARALGAPRGTDSEGIIDQAAMLPLLIGAPDEAPDPQDPMPEMADVETPAEPGTPTSAEDAETLPSDDEAKLRSEAAA